MAKNSQDTAAEVVEVAPTDTVSVATAPAAPAESDVTGILVSKLDHPVVIAYGDRQLRLSARGQTGLLNKRELSKALPSGVIFVSRSV